MKLFMLWDMEGTSGIFTREQVWYWEEGVRPEVAADGKALLMADINTATTAALAAGVDEVIVCDTHGGGGNIVLDRMVQDPRVSYLQRSRGFQDGKFRWLPGLDESVDGFLVPGHHAMAGTPNTFLPHTWNLDWGDFRINGESTGEMGIEACFAGHWGIPTIFASGDEVACREAEGMFPGIVTAAVKRPLDHDHCEGLDPEAAHVLLAEKVTEAVARLRAGECHAFQPELPMLMSVRMTSPESVDALATRPGITRRDDCTLEAVLERRCDVVNWLIGTGLDMPDPE